MSAMTTSASITLLEGALGAAALSPDSPAVPNLTYCFCVCTATPVSDALHTAVETAG